MSFLLRAMAMFGVVALLGCADNELQSVDTSHLNDEVASAGHSSSNAALPLLRVERSGWYAGDKRVDLHGTNLGNWLLLEFWMMAQRDASIHDQCGLEQTFDQRFGVAERKRLMRLYRDNWITERDWNLLQAFNVNLVRLPFNWNLIEDEFNPYTLRDDAWDYIDEALAQAQARGIYVILDLHGAVGGQGWEHHSGCADKNQLWQNAEYQARTKWLWSQIAQRYRDRHVIAGFGVLNEPWGAAPEVMADFSEQLYAVIRAEDPHHAIILPGHVAGVDAYGDVSSRGLSNVALEMHFYPGHFGWETPSYKVHRDWLTCGASGMEGICRWDQQLQQQSAGFIVGEFQPWQGLPAELGAKITRASFDAYNQLGWAATSWSYKVLTAEGGLGGWGMVSNHADQALQKIDFKSASLAQIEARFTWFGEMPYFENRALKQQLKQPQAADIFNLPSTPAQPQLSVQSQNAEARTLVVLDWQDQTAAEKANGDERSYRIYASEFPDIGYQPLVETQTRTFQETIASGINRYYQVVSLAGIDESYPSERVALPIQAYHVPGNIPIAGYVAKSGAGVQQSSDSASAFNLAWIKGGDWFDYALNVAQADTFICTLRVATQAKGKRLSLALDRKTLTQMALPLTGGWQVWESVSAELALPAGRHRLRLLSLDDDINVSALNCRVLADTDALISG